ncbi:TolC family protein [Treponema zioleckii]|uniref:TolC family protein n=1 Tax=Treponema zioleckii TaxID=331680 RepID=UPI00168B69E4|nr:TolC family protein [Treponema zioleckii]
MKIRKLCVTLLVSVAVVFSAFGEDSQKSEKNKLEITVDSAVESALKTHVSIKRESIELNQAERNYKHSWNNFLPSISASVTGSASDSSSYTSGETLTASGSLDASLSLNASLAQKIEILKQAYESGKADYEDTVREVETTVRKSFYSILYQQKKVESYKSSLDSYLNQYNQTKIKRNSGLVPELDLLTAEVNLKSAQVALKTAEKTYYNAAIEFLNEIGIEINPSETEVIFAGSLDDADLIQEVKLKNLTKEKIDELVESSPEVRSLKSSLDSAKLTKTYTAVSAYSPSLKLSASVTPKELSYTVKNSDKSTGNSWNASVGISIPLDSLVPGSSSRDSVSEKDDSVKDLELQLEDKRKSLRTSIVEKVHSIEISRETLEERKLNVELAQKTYQMTYTAYRNGTKDLLALQNALTSYQEAEVEWRSEQYNLMSYVLDLENLLGIPSGSFTKNAESQNESSETEKGN